MSREAEKSEIECVGCGCTDAQACPGGCSWAAVEEEAGIGLCTNCAVQPLDLLLETVFASLITDHRSPVTKGVKP